MGEQMKLWDQMADARHRAVAAQEKMLHWRVNRSAIYALMADERAAQSDPLGIRFEERPFYGLPFKVDENNRSPEPTFKLMTLESLDRK
ncbi:hypothetical protein [Sphingobium bisphenolivorans]|uniref:hypothetical protein n=1 Tax=Sphingobium bisphenolivorans TaxID=1335760 RepID=UPI0003A3585E|nr:hypothetical protein [Sphingobium bisphenolivorans]